MMSASQTAYLTLISRKTRNNNPIKCSDSNETTGFFLKCFQPSQLIDPLSERLHPLMG